MNRKEWKKLSKDKKNKEFWFWRNKAVKFFNLQKGEVIHHLIETEEQKEFNKNYYERWGFDFDNVMKYCIKMTKEEHDNYHSSLRKGKHNTNEHNKKVSESLKKFYSTPEGKEVIKKSQEKRWSKKENHEKQSQTIKEYFSNEENRKKLSDSMKGLKLWTNGEKNVWAHECPDGYVKAESPKKGKHWHQKSKIRMIMCVETGEVLNVNEVKEKDLYNHTKHAADVANGKRKIAGGFHWEWVD